ncbi:hypothetical protein [Hoeflea prorocentri]|uniref:Cysteine rich repeat-containing protein n=1 Tax=Hoeflea prorocentri TaxID=1922333 RepID=A0A9X3UKY2_9HYPH|nr:hypothetical protein [Hoeflea prorocentri]MCY6381079.1 hypothetical protein [Hoeflea prorocentri]MDA5398879.1 hypothetical protein [Hoeflea prorocentri]
MLKTILPVAAAALTFSALAAFAQTPTPAQQQAIKSNCVADYRANCAGVPTGGMDALICLEQHEDKLSSACKSAVEAVDHNSASTPTTAPKATSEATTTTAAKPKSEAESATASGGAKTETSAPAASAAGAAPASGKPAMSLRQEMRLAARACARDYRVLCPNLPAGQGNVLFCLKVHEEHLSPQCHKAILDAGEVF